MSTETPDIRTLRKIKFQNKNFEAGEFFDVHEVNCSTALIEVKKHFFSTGKINYLDKPSITFEDASGNYLSIEFDASRQVIIHYYSCNKKLYNSTVARLEDSYRFIELFFLDTPFSIMHFKRKRMSEAAAEIKFKDGTFRYCQQEKSMVKYLLKKNWFSILVFLIIVPGFFLSSFKVNISGQAAVFIMLFLVLVIGGLVFSYHLNYYKYSLDKVLIMSKGNNTFYYGHYLSPKCYTKKEIRAYIIYESSKHRNNFLSSFEFIAICFNDNSSIIIPYNILPIEELRDKLNNSSYSICRNVPYPIPET